MEHGGFQSSRAVWIVITAKNIHVYNIPSIPSVTRIRCTTVVHGKDKHTEGIGPGFMSAEERVITTPTVLSKVSAIGGISFAGNSTATICSLFERSL